MMSITEILKDEAVRAYLHRLIGEDGLDLLEKFPEQGEYSDEELPRRPGSTSTLSATPSTPSTRRGLQSTGGSRTRRPAGSPTSGRCASTGSRAAVTEDMKMMLEKLEARETFEEENDFYLCKNCGTFTFNEVMEVSTSHAPGAPSPSSTSTTRRSSLP